jgi:hypothetical protein
VPENNGTDFGVTNDHRWALLVAVDEIGTGDKARVERDRRAANGEFLERSGAAISKRPG